MPSIKKGQIYVDETGQVMTVQKTDDTGIHVDEEGQKKHFMDETEFEEYRKKKKYEKSNVSLDDEFPEDDEEEKEEEEIPEPPEEEEDEEGEDEIPEPPADDDSEDDTEDVSKKDKFKELYLQMLDLGATGNDKIDKAVEKLKKELSSELNTMTSESWEQIEEQLKSEGYLS